MELLSSELERNFQRDWQLKSNDSRSTVDAKRISIDQYRDDTHARTSGSHEADINQLQEFAQLRETAKRFGCTVQRIAPQHNSRVVEYTPSQPALFPSPKAAVSYPIAALSAFDRLGPPPYTAVQPSSRAQAQNRHQIHACQKSVAAPHYIPSTNNDQVVISRAEFDRLKKTKKTRISHGKIQRMQRAAENKIKRALSAAQASTAATQTAPTSELMETDQN